MNKHLNIFNSYAKTDRNYQLENDLTRAMAICLQEDTLFFNSVLQNILSKNDYDGLFMEYSSESNLSVEIQVDVNSLESFNKLYAVSISGSELLSNEFFETIKSKKDKKHITDLVIVANDIVIIVEVKPNEEDCTWQLAQQAYKSIENTEIPFEQVKPIDLSWKKLMRLATISNNFSDTTQNKSRFLADFIWFVKGHNHNWLPVASFSSLPDSINSKDAYNKRLNSALASLSKDHSILEYSNRIGFQLDKSWAKEIVINIHNYKKNEAAIWFGIWPGNTKGQGHKMHKFLEKNKNWQPPNSLEIDGEKFVVKWEYEIKFCHFNKYITNLIVGDDDIKPGKELISRNIHNNHTGKYNKDQWDDLKNFLDEHLIIDWRTKMGWEKNFAETNRGYLTLSIGYQIQTVIPVSYLQKIDKEESKIENLSSLMLKIKEKYEKLFEN